MGGPSRVRGLRGQCVESVLHRGRGPGVSLEEVSCRSLTVALRAQLGHDRPEIVDERAIGCFGRVEIPTPSVHVGDLACVADRERRRGSGSDVQRRRPAASPRLDQPDPELRRFDPTVRGLEGGRGSFHFHPREVVLLGDDLEVLSVEQWVSRSGDGTRNQCSEGEGRGQGSGRNSRDKTT